MGICSSTVEEKWDLDEYDRKEISSRAQEPSRSVKEPKSRNEVKSIKKDKEKESAIKSFDIQITVAQAVHTLNLAL
jgi:hypothetical protein